MNLTNEIFFIETSGPRPSNVSPVKFLACCKNFVDFQIDPFIKDGTFPLKKINCNYTWVRRDYDSDIDFAYSNDPFEIYYNNNNDNDDDSSDDDDEQTSIASNCFVSFVYYTEMRTNLKFETFCQSCKEIFKIYFLPKLHIFSNSYFQFE